MFFFKKAKTEVVDHWYQFVDNFQTSSQKFYDSVEKELQVRKLPGLQASRVEWNEAGLLSANREYLRLTRERWVFDICAAPFGTGYFFSYRFAEIPATVKLWELLVLLGALGLGALLSFSLFLKIFGLLAPFLWPVACLGVLVLAIYAMRNAKTIGIKDLDAMLLQTPVLNAVYEAWFRRETYYREDTRLMYLATVPAVVKKLAEEVTVANGVKLPGHIQGKPLLKELSPAA